MRKTALTLLIGVWVGLAHAAGNNPNVVQFNRDTLRRFGQVSVSICRGYLELFNPVAGLRELRDRARAAHNREAFAFEDRLINTSTSPFLRQPHAREDELHARASRTGQIPRTLVNHRYLYVKGEGLRRLPRGTAILIDPETAIVVSVFPFGR